MKYFQITLKDRSIYFLCSIYFLFFVTWFLKYRFQRFAFIVLSVLRSTTTQYDNFERLKTEFEITLSYFYQSGLKRNVWKLSNLWLPENRFAGLLWWEYLWFAVIEWIQRPEQFHGIQNGRFYDLREKLWLSNRIFCYFFPFSEFESNIRISNI